MKNLKAENPCNMDLLSGGGGQDALAGACSVGTRQCDKQASTTMPPLRPERKWRELTNSATIDYRCVEFDRREPTESVAERLPQLNPSKILAFTMAEILLSLTIIGVVAAITLPSLTGNINERTWNTQRKALYARMSQAIALMPSLNGYGTVTEGDSSTSAVDTAAETFVTAGLSKVLKINNICDSEHIKDCGINESFNALNGSKIDTFPLTLKALNDMFNGSCIVNNDVVSVYSQANTRVAAFETANGESIAVYYNPNCQSSLGESYIYGSGTEDYIQPKMCANFIYDLNGLKGPNTIGKDMGFITALYPSDPVLVAPYPAKNPAGSAKQQDASKLCRAQNPEYRLPNADELASMFFNKQLIYPENMPNGTGGFYTSGTFVHEGSYTSAILQNFISGVRVSSKEGLDNNDTRAVWCVKR